MLIGIFVFIIGLLFESFIFSSQFLGYLWWSEKTISPLGWQILSFVPFFNFGRMFLDITTRTSGRLDQLTDTYIPGPGFVWDDLYTKFGKDLLVPIGSDGYPNLPAPVQTWHIQIGAIFGYYILTWYLDAVVKDDFGARQPLWFFVLPSYWGFSISKEHGSSSWLKRNTSGKANLKLEGDEDSDVLLEREKALNSDCKAALQVVNLRKTYTQYSLFRMPAVKAAVRSSCFTVEQGTLLALLGQNGAGKSTTIGMLSGLTPSSGGDALIFGKSVRTGMSEIRKVMGICPQHDIIFDDLTAREHVELYAGLKGVPESDLKVLIEERLGFVRLLSVADVRAGTYSGGYSQTKSE